MKIAFRVDSSVEIGSGHVMRCLTFADELALHHIEIVFICRRLAGNMGSYILERGYPVFFIPDSEESNTFPETSSDKGSSAFSLDWVFDSAEVSSIIKREVGPVDWIVVDHYGLDARWEKSLSVATARMMVIDDLANRPHDCDLLLDQNFYEDQERRYVDLISPQCRTLLGTQYVLLRKEFSEAVNRMRIRNGEIGRVLVFFGATDSGNQTLKTLQALSLLSNVHIEIDVILGVNNPFKQVVTEYSQKHLNIHCHDYVSDMAEMMLRSDLYIGAAGITTWERCCLGLPSIVITVAQNQIAPIRDLERTGAIVFLGEADRVSVKDISSVVSELATRPERLLEIGKKGMTLVDGYGVKRCAFALLNYEGGNANVIV